MITIQMKFSSTYNRRNYRLGISTTLTDTSVGLKSDYDSIIGNGERAHKCCP